MCRCRPRASVESIRSVLPIVNEFVVAFGPRAGRAAALLEGLGSSKLRVIRTPWNQSAGAVRQSRARVYDLQKALALRHCAGDWAFFLEAAEAVHEADHPSVLEAMEYYLHDLEVEALTFDYLHFYGNRNTLAWSPAWRRREARIFRNTSPGWVPRGSSFVVLDSALRGRHPRAAHSNATIYRYDWIRPDGENRPAAARMEPGLSPRPAIAGLDQVDARILRPFAGSHPAVMRAALPPANGLFRPDPNYRLTGRERHHRLVTLLEGTFDLDLTRKSFKPIRRAPPIRPPHAPIQLPREFQAAPVVAEA